MKGTKRIVESFLGDDSTYKIEYIRLKKETMIQIFNEYYGVYTPEKTKINRSPIGVLISTKINGELRLGWSLCHKKDKFNIERGIEYACNRAMYHYHDSEPLPQSITIQYHNFAVKSAKYFKTGDFKI